MSEQNKPPLFSRLTWPASVLLLVAVITVFIAVFVLRGQHRGTGQASTVVEKGLPAPDFAARTLTGETVRLSDFRGKPVVLNFFAGWCSPCKKEAPYLQDAYEKKQGDTVFLGVTFQDTEASARYFAEQHGLTFPVLLDETEEIGKTYHVRSFPVTVFIRPDGVIHTIVKGPVTREFVLVMLESMNDITASS